MNHVVEPNDLSFWQSQHTSIATSEDLEPLVGLLNLACSDDRLVNWITQNQVENKEELFRLILTNVYLSKTGAITNEEHSGLLCWISPKEHTATRQELISLLPQIKKMNNPSRQSSFDVSGLKLLQPLKRNLRTYHIAILAVHPDKQNQGIANLLLEPLFKKSHAQKIPVTVELTDENQLSIFRHYGFHVIESVDIPTGPTVWHLMRAPN